MSRVKTLLRSCVDNLDVLEDRSIQLENLIAGKMLRTSFAARLAESCHDGDLIRVSISACGAAELVHSASLCHDDVIDNALIRRGSPALWQMMSQSGAILIGDLLFCEALLLLYNSGGSRYISGFISKIREVCTAEIKQEIRYRGIEIDEQTCLDLARGKTGPLFAFVGSIFGGNEPGLSRALEEASYTIGTVYQLADDVIDATGDESISKKTLGTDADRGKYTLTRFYSREDIGNKMSELCKTALERLNDWPEKRFGLETFIKEDLQPIFDQSMTGISVLAGY